MMLRSFLKDSAIYSIPALLSRGLYLFLVPLYTRVLSPSDYGSLDLLTVFAGIINLTIGLEVSQGVARFYAAERDPERKVAYASSAFWFTLTCYCVFAVVTLLFADPLSGLIMGQEGLEAAFSIGVLYISVSGIFLLIQNQFRWELRSKEYAAITMLMSLVNAVTSFCLAYRLSWGIEGLLLGMLAGNLVGVLAGVWRLRASFRFIFNSALLLEMLAFSTPLVLSSVAVWVSLYIDRMMINHFLTIEEVGLYGIGYRVASIVGLVMVGFQGSLNPLVYTYYREAETHRQLARIFRIFLFFGLMAFIALSLAASEILRFMTGPSFYGSAVVVFYLVPALMLSNMYIFAPGIGIAKRTHYFVWINIGAALLNTLLNILLIPLLGIVGAALATMLNYLVVFIIQMVLSQRLYHVPHRWSSIIAAALLAGALAWWLPRLPLANAERWASTFLSLLVFTIASVCLGLVRIDELRQVKSLVRSWLY